MVLQRASLAMRFGAHGTEAEYLLEGWSTPEDGFRWAVGNQCSLRLLPLSGREDLILTLETTPAPIDGLPTQVVHAYVNDRLVGRMHITGPSEHMLIVPRSLLSDREMNILCLRFGHHARPGEIDAREDRALALLFRSLRLEPTPIKLLPRAALLPGGLDSPPPSDWKYIAERFESLGQNCEFGMWQRRCGAEPLGLFRFASARLNKVLRGVRTDFEGLGDPRQLTLRHRWVGDEYMGHHEYYELDYHTFRNHGDVDGHALLRGEPARLSYLARELMASIRSAEKIFVVQRGDLDLTLEEVLPLLLSLRSLNSTVQLLYVTTLGSAPRSLHGRVERIAPGLFHGLLERLAPSERAWDCDFHGWLSLCTAVTAASCDESGG